MPADAEFNAGQVSGCTVEDRPALWEMCRATEPLASVQEIGNSLQDADFARWAVYRDRNSRIRIAVYMNPNGTIHLLMQSEDMSDPEVKQGFLELARGVHKAFKVNGITDLVIVCPKVLRPFMAMLTNDGFVSAEIYTIHGMHFTGAGQIDRAQ